MEICACIWHSSETSAKTFPSQTRRTQSNKQIIIMQNRKTEETKKKQLTALDISTQSSPRVCLFAHCFPTIFAFFSLILFVAEKIFFDHCVAFDYYLYAAMHFPSFRCHDFIFRSMNVDACGALLLTSHRWMCRASAWFRFVFYLHYVCFHTIVFCLELFRTPRKAGTLHMADLK